MSGTLKFELALWLAGMAGVAAVTFIFLPQLLAKRPVRGPLPLLLLASLVQSGLLLALAVWAGATLAPQVGLFAPAFAALVGDGSVRAALQPQLIPGVVGGLCGAVVLISARAYAPATLGAYFASVSPSRPARIFVGMLYGGITEELLLRWGVMTFLLWLAWRFIEQQPGLPALASVLGAIGASALLFGAGHLPAVKTAVGALTRKVVVFIVVANSAFGIVAGFLFWGYGLEAAILAHAIAHLLGHWGAEAPKTADF